MLWIDGQWLRSDPILKPGPSAAIEDIPLENRKAPVNIGEVFSGQGQDRTADLRFFRPSLFRLSYLAEKWLFGGDDGI